MTGRLDLGYQWTHLPEPPWGVLQRPAHQGGLRPYTCLAESTWVAAMVVYLKDLEAMEDRMGQRHRSSGGGAAQAGAAAERKKVPAGRRQRGGTGGGGKGAPAAAGP